MKLAYQVVMTAALIGVPAPANGQGNDPPQTDAPSKTVNAPPLNLVSLEDISRRLDALQRLSSQTDSTLTEYRQMMEALIKNVTWQRQRIAVLEGEVQRLSAPVQPTRGNGESRRMQQSLAMINLTDRDVQVAFHGKTILVTAGATYNFGHVATGTHVYQINWAGDTNVALRMTEIQEGKTTEVTIRDPQRVASAR